ncbi:hypothetical protein BC829DRAFT_258740 [Chytridium lagenaria]|nr:hypothetical protein BC829DRAFT_258740 [Chytridium lagenaria]
MGIRYVYGDGEYDDIKLARQRTVATVLFMVAILILTILLLNIFVAMLNTTFSQVYAESERQWRLQYARLIMEIDERILTQYHRYPPSLQSARPITRIGVSRIAPNLEAVDQDTVGI